MRGGLRGLAVGSLIVGLALHGSPAYAAPADSAADGPAVSLVVGLKAGADTAAPAERLEAGTDVDVVATEPLVGDTAVTVDVDADNVTEATAALRSDPNVSYVEMDQVAHMSAVPNDPSYSGQWGLPLTHVTQAWDATRGSSAVVIAVVDTGVRPVGDLAGRTLPGYNFVSGNTNTTDDEGHGTMTAGVIGDAANNAAGSAGICWYCKILPVKVLDSTGSGLYSNIANGIRYAADQHADVINLSLGGSADNRVLSDAVTYAVGKGSLVIAAAGNDGTSVKHYPAAYPNALAVGATTATDTRYSWSNFGAAWVDIAAPGCNLAQGMNGVVGTFCGTSSATPFASGVAGLLASATPKPTAAQIRTAMTTSAAALPGNWVAAGSGRVNAAAALDKLPFWLTGVAAGGSLSAAAVLRPHVGAGSGITEVRAKLNGATVGVATAAPWTLNLNTSAYDGSATLTVVASAGAAVKGTATVPVVVDHTAPATSFRFPAASAVVHGLVTLGINGWDAVGVARVQLLLGTTLLGTDYAAPWAFQWSSAGRSGATTLAIRTWDAAGNMTTGYRTVNVDNWGPSVLIRAAPVNGARGVRGIARVAATSADLHGINRMELLVDGVVAGRWAGTAHTFTVDTSKWGAAMSVRVRAYDALGNVRYTPIRTWYR
jgi:thermitase